MKALGLTLTLLLSLARACPLTTQQQSLSHLHLYAGYVRGIDEAGYHHAVAAFCDEMAQQPELFSATEVTVIRYGDRNSVRATPVLKLKLPAWPDCQKGGLFKTGKSEREKQCQEKRAQVEIEFKEQVRKIQQALAVAPQSQECVSYLNLLTRLRFEPNRPPSIVITDASHACQEANAELEPLATGNAPLIVIQVATGSDFAERNQFISRLLNPQQVIPGTSAESAVMALKNANTQVAQR